MFREMRRSAQAMPQEYTTYYRNVIVFGRAKIITDESLKIAAVKALVDKHPNGFTDEEILDKIKGGLDKKCVVEIEIGHMTGKENWNLAEERRENVASQATTRDGRRGIIGL